MRLHLLFIFIIAISCSTNKKKESVYEYDAETKVDIPAWVYDIGSECDSKIYLCASSEGESLEEADINSKKTLASILELRVNSRSEIKRFGLTAIESKGLEENVSIEVKEEVDMILNGAQTIKRFKKNESFYSYSVLNKKNAVVILKNKIKGLDAKLSSLYSEGRRVYVNRLLVILSKRQALEREVLILDGKVRKSPVSFENIYNLKKDVTKAKDISIRVLNNIPSSLLTRVEEELTSLGFVISKSSASSLIKVSFNSEEEYLNVKGFKKFTFSLKLESFSSKKMVKKGILHVKKVITGRSQRSALSSVVKKIASQIKIDIDKLNI